jgi:hypothetical protein
MVVRVRVTGGDLDIPEVDAGVEHGRDRGVAEHMGVRPGDPDAGAPGELVQAAGGRVPVHPGAAAVEQDRPAHAGSGRWPGRPLAATGSGRSWCPCRTHGGPGGRAPRRVGDVRAGGLEDPQAQQTEHGHQREIVRVRRFSCCGEQRLELQVGEPQVGDSAGTMGATDVLGR